MPVTALVDARYRTNVEVAASAYDTRSSGNGCSPNGCIPENTRDRSTANNSRWSCKGDLMDDDTDQRCWIEYYFEEPQDIVEIRISFYKGTKNTRTLDVYDNGAYHSEIESSGETNWYQTFYLDTDETETLRLYLDDSSTKTWLSIKEVGPNPNVYSWSNGAL